MIVDENTKFDELEHDWVWFVGGTDIDACERRQESRMFPKVIVAATDAQLASMTPREAIDWFIERHREAVTEMRRERGRVVYQTTTKSIPRGPRSASPSAKGA